MAGIGNAVMHFMVKVGDLFDIRDMAENTLAFIANGYPRKFFKQPEVEEVEDNKAQAIGPDRGNGGDDK